MSFIQSYGYLFLIQIQIEVTEKVLLVQFVYDTTAQINVMLSLRQDSLLF